MKVITLEVPLGVHHESTDSCYSGGFVEITKCSDCKAIQDYWSNNTKICEYCGGTLMPNGIGKWNKQTKQWQIRQNI